MPFGQGVGVVAVGTAAGNVAVNAYHAVKVSQMQSKFQQQLENDQANIDYIKNIVLRTQSIAERLARTSGIQPGTYAFESALKQALVNEMNYQGNCNADIYVPFGPGDIPGKPRTVMGSFTNVGHVRTSMLPMDTGPIWATGCKNAVDTARKAFVEAYKGEHQFSRLKQFKEQLGLSDLAVRFGTGLFMLIVIMVALKLQKKVIKKQKGTTKK